MRDSNFDIDFVKDAQKAAAMLYQETGQHVDGVIAIDLSFVQNLVAVVSPIEVLQYDEVVTANNFFMLTETHSDKHSFAGSTQKQDFLRSLFDSIQAKIQTNKIAYFMKCIPVVTDAIKQKHLLLAVFNTKTQSILTENRFSSSLLDGRKKNNGTIKDFFGINEANIGANKANYFLDRSINQHTNISPRGVISGITTITYTNKTKTDTWPSGAYKNYLRIILPLHTKLLSITIDGISQHLVPAVTNFRVYDAPDFHPPNGLEVDTSEEEGKTIYGFIVSVGIATTKKVTISYQHADTINTNRLSIKYDLYVFKQPGMNNDFYYFSLTYPNSYKSNNDSYLSQLSTDKEIAVDLSRK